MIVYEIQGWFGGTEWSEGLWASEEAAEKVCNELWRLRKSDKFPEYNGLCKFVVEPIVVA